MSGDFRPLALQAGYATPVKRLGCIAFLVGCSFQGASPSSPIDASTPTADASVPGDGAPLPPPIDARQCFGVGLLNNLCLAKAPAADVTLSSSINTDATGTCTQVFPQTGSPTAAPELCAIAGKTIAVQSTVTVTGSRALVLIGAETVVVAAGATLDASSTTNGTPRKAAGANLGACAKPGSAGNDNGGAGGGAGGSLATKGGNGGKGNLNAPGGSQNAAKGGSAGPTQPAPTLLRGGCPGGKGGDSQIINNVGNGGAGGNGGGAVYLIAGTSITVTGDVFASGAGGDATPNNAGAEQGGGGGGTGGMIGLDAPTVTVNGRVVANGGAGGGGGGLNTGGKPGGDGTTTSWNTRAAPGGAGTGGGGVVSGAPGTAINLTDQIDGPDADGGGGGGGGGMGIVTIYGKLMGNMMISPAPATHGASAARY
jgi:hypothetical protein